MLQGLGIQVGFSMHRLEKLLCLDERTDPESLAIGLGFVGFG